MPEPKVYRRPSAPQPPAVDEDARIIFLPVERIRPNRAQPRNRFDTNTMIRLADSVRRYGVLQPLTVRYLPPSGEQTENAPIYELIAGERRLRAAKLAGLSQVPCVLAHADDHLSAELAVIENLLREDLDMFEQARAFGQLIVKFSLTQEQVARKMSMSQSAVANKLRLLRLSEAEQRSILSCGLTERHARALLRLPADGSRLDAIRYIAEQKLNVAAGEQYIEELLNRRNNNESENEPTAKAMPKTFEDKKDRAETFGKKKLVIKDLRIFYNSLENAVEILKQTGLRPEIEQREEGERVVICITVDNPGKHPADADVSRETS